MRKQILGAGHPAEKASESNELDIAAIATVLVSSEAAQHPIENAFDSRPGPGASHWVAANPGEQTLILAFDTPQTVQQIALEVEELEHSRTQELQVAVSHDGGQSYRELLRQEFNFSPPGTTYQRESWATMAEAVTHLRLWIKPDKGGGPYRARLTSLTLR